MSNTNELKDEEIGKVEVEDFISEDGQLLEKCASLLNVISSIY